MTVVISKFGHYLGLTINWSKSALMVLDREQAVDLPDPGSNLIQIPGNSNIP